MSGMECPYCKSQMERGSLRSRGGVYFLPEGEKIPKLYLDSQFKKHNSAKAVRRSGRKYGLPRC